MGETPAADMSSTTCLDGERDMMLVDEAKVLGTASASHV